jgi:co-chaperonin GroES (HSP10)
MRALGVVRVVLAGLSLCGVVALAQAPAKPVTQRGTVKAVAGNSLTVTSDAGAQMVVTVPDGAKLLQVAPGSTDLKAAQTIMLGDIGVGDKVLVTGKPGETADAFDATRVILMKSGDIAAKRAAEQADWQKRGMGGIVTAAGPAGVTFSSGAKKIQIQTTDKTVFMRYAPDSIKFEDAKPGTRAQILVGDQIEVRGAKTEDGLSIAAEEVVSGSFLNLSGTLASVNAAAGTVTLKDLTTKKMMTVAITANSDMRKLPPELAARFAARQRGGTGEAGAGAGAAGGAPARAPYQPGAGGMAGAGRSGGGMGAGGVGGGRSAGMDLSKMLTRLPAVTVTELKTGDAVMIVASTSQGQGKGDTATAVTLLSGVEPILAATPTGTQAMTLSPWSVGGGAPEAPGGP